VALARERSLGDNRRQRHDRPHRHYFTASVPRSLAACSGIVGAGGRPAGGAGCSRVASRTGGAGRPPRRAEASSPVTETRIESPVFMRVSGAGLSRPGIPLQAPGFPLRAAAVARAVRSRSSLYSRAVSVTVGIGSSCSVPRPGGDWHLPGPIYVCDYVGESRQPHTGPRCRNSAENAPRPPDRSAGSVLAR
jgi:hypothetical protein